MTQFLIEADPGNQKWALLWVWQSHILGPGSMVTNEELRDKDTDGILPLEKYESVK